MRLSHRVIAAVATALVGFLVGGFTAGVIWVFTAADLPEGGSGNGRDGQLWFTLGGVVGAVVLLTALALAGRFRGRRARTRAA